GRSPVYCAQPFQLAPKRSKAARPWTRSWLTGRAAAIFVDAPELGREPLPAPASRNATPTPRPPSCPGSSVFFNDSPEASPSPPHIALEPTEYVIYTLYHTVLPALTAGKTRSTNLMSTRKPGPRVCAQVKHETSSATRDCRRPSNRRRLPWLTLPLPLALSIARPDSGCI
ncbi:hypothetical protein FRC08_007113, partial [Ceratobasidium sp. 394]